MLGFFAEGASTDITLLDNELEDARWFTRDEIINSVNDGSLVFPPSVAISFRLIEQWFNKGGKGLLRDITQNQKQF